VQTRLGFAGRNLRRNGAPTPLQRSTCFGSGTPDELCVCPEGLKRNLILDS